jgi:tryptophan 2,3-dioxygenase
MRQAEGVSEPAGGPDYASYLLIDDLLSLQRPLTQGAHDELLFIVVHQSFELWFKLILHELERVVAVERLLLEHLDVLETMGPEGFLEFRDPLAPASGFQSRQFRSIEWISGLRETWPGGEPPPGRPLYEAFCAAGRADGLELPEGEDEAARAARVGALARLYREHAADSARSVLHSVAERLVDHDEAFARWRSLHVLMVARAIGTRPGTGGSRGVAYLRTTVDRRFFPELWEIRVAL